MKKQLNTALFAAALRGRMAGSKRKLADVLHQQMKGVVRNLVAVTPPSNLSGNRRQGAAAKKWGEDRVASQIRSLFQPISPRSIAKARGGGKTVITDLAATHRANRKADGSVRRIPEKFLTDSVSLKQYIKAIQKHVGYLASGWKSAMRKFGVSIPAWIDRNNGRSRQPRVNTSGTILTIQVFNDVKFADANRRLAGQVQWALDSQANQMLKQLRAFAAKRDKV